MIYKVINKSNCIDEKLSDWFTPKYSGILC